MFCPNCGTKTSEEQKFCRSCGLPVQRVVEVLNELLPDRGAHKRKKIFEEIGGWAVLILIGMIFVTVGYAIFVKMILVPEKMWVGIFMFAFVLLAAVALIFLGLGGAFDERPKRVSTARDNALPNPETAKLLEEKPFEAVPASVVERTTELLYAEPRGGKTTDELR